MNSFELNVLGLDISFRTEAEAYRVERARAFVEEQYDKISQNGSRFSKERLLTLLILGLADDLLQTQHRLDGVEQRLAELLHRIEKAE